jgi:hypothetical protein
MSSLNVFNDIAKLKWAFDDEFNNIHNSCTNYIQNDMTPESLGLEE